MSTFIGSSLRLNGPEQNNSNQLAGCCAGAALTSGFHNNFFGYCAGSSNTTASNNNFFGFCAGRTNSSASSNNFFGRCAGRDNTTGSHNNFFGYFAGRDNTTGQDNNFIGRCTGRVNTTGQRNDFIGGYAGYNNTTGRRNIFIGFVTGGSNTCGCFNTFLGQFAGRCTTTGCYNTFIGSGAGCRNTAGTNNLLIGCNTGGVTPAGLVCITTQDNRIIMGNAAHVCAQIQIGWTTVSDTRDKCIYGAIERGLGFLRGITPIEYQFKDRENDEITDPVRKRRYGFSAQEILELEGDHPVIVSDEDPDKLQITTDHLLPVMVNAIKELAEKLEQQQQRIEALENIINSED